MGILKLNVAFTVLLSVPYVLALADTWGNTTPTIPVAEKNDSTDVTLLLANRQDIRLLKLQTTEEANSTILLGNQENVAWVDFVYRDRSIYYADINERGQSRIHRLDLELDANLDLVPSPMGPRTVISKGLGTISGLACDWRNHKLYLVDLDRKVIEVSETDGSLRKVLIWRDLEKPRDVTLDPVHGYMFWVDWNPGSPKIERAGMDGTMRTAIVSRGLDMPYSLTLDYASMKLFWTDTHLNSIHSSDYSGYSLRPVSVESSQQFVALTVFNEDLFWSDWLSSSIWAVEKEEGAEKRLIASYMNAPLDVRVFAEERQPLASPNPCDFDNGYCASLCLLSPDQPFYSCACKTGIKLDKENGTCADYPEEFLIFAQRTSIHMISLDTEEHIPQLITDEDVLGAVSVDYDHVEQHVYWSDYQKGTIERIKLDGTERQIVVAGDLEYPDGIAVDWVSRTLYWTDAGRDRIEVSRLDGTARRVIVFDGLDEPRAIVVDPERGYLYWSDWGDPSRIERASLDGKNRTTLINTPEGWPNGIAIDYKQGRIMWGTAKYRKIESADMEGSNRSVIVDNTRHIFGFSLGGDYIYWTDWSTQKIERAQKHTGIGREDIATLSDLMGLKVVTQDILAISNECATNNGGCSHVCIYNPKGISCLCPSNMELFREDKRTCIYPGPALVYWADNDLRKLSLEGNSGKVDTIITDADLVGETDTDAREGRVYWTNPQLKTISRAFINGTGQEIIIGVDVKEPWGLSVDWMARNLYFTDTGNAHIELCKLDGSNRKILIKDRLSGPKSIAVDPKNGYLFWTDWGNIPTIERSLLDGTERMMLVINCPSSYLAVDSEQRRIYWVVPDENRIESSDMSGKDKWLLLDKRLKKPTSLSVFGNTVLFANSRRNMIESVDKRFGENRTLVKAQQDDVTGFSIFHPSLQPFLFHNPCANNNGGCEIFCLVRPGEADGTLTRVCQCPLNKYLNQDKRTCSEFSNYLIVSVHDRFHRIPIDSAEGKDTILPIRLPSDEVVKALDFDPVDKMIYWIDATTKTIKRAPEFGTKPELFLGDFPGVGDFDPFDVVVDPYNRILIFSDETNDFIGFSKMEERNVTGTLYEEVEKRPRYIGLLPEKGRLYWTDSKPKSPKIMTASLDTSNTRVLYRLFDHPTAYTLDNDLQRMFWMDSVTHGIEICNVEERFRKGQILNCADMSMTLWRKQTNGPTRKFVQDFQCGTSVENEMMGTATGLAVYRDDLYWIDKDNNVIASRDVYGRGVVTIFRENLVGLTDIKAVSGDIRRSHPCLGGGGCSHLCLVNDDGEAECVCPKRLSLAEDGMTCEVPTSCTDDQFECMSGSIYCIPMIWRCDQLQECEDGSDEIGCEDESQNGP